MERRKYQYAARDAVLKEWSEGNKRTLLVLPPACGKTVSSAYVLQTWLGRYPRSRVLFLAHREELLFQAADTIHTLSGLPCALEKAASTAVGTDERIVLASVQTISQEKRLHRYPKNYFSAIIVDEAHHSLSESYQRVLNYFSGAKVLGITATPHRSDLQDLGTYYDSCAYEYPLENAIADGYVPPIKARVAPLELDISKVRIRSGDYSPSELSATIDPYLARIANEVVKYCWTRKTLVFLPSVACSKQFCQLLTNRGMKAAEVDGSSGGRSLVLDGFKKGVYNILCNTMLLTEGWDCPDIDCIIILRPTQSRTLYQQMVGRGMRPTEKKKDLLILDFKWLTSKRPICRPSCLISRDTYVAEHIDQKMFSTKGGVRLDVAEHESEVEIVAERESAMAKELEELRKDNGTDSGVSPIQYAISVSAEALLNYQAVFKWELAAPTEKQLEFISKNGVDASLVRTKGEASKIIDILIERRHAGCSTPKQIRYLEQRGFKMVGSWPFAAASQMMDAIAKNNWKIPQGIDPKAFRP